MLSIVATPIGNISDITLRAIEKLQFCDAIVCEDTRIAGQLLTLLHLPKKELISFHGYSDPRRVPQIIARLEKGDKLCLISDAGTPGISDPGYEIVTEVRKRGLPLEVIPGPSAFLAALSASGLPMHQFIYLGFLPIKKGRQTMLKTFLEEEKTIVFYESVHRIEKTLGQLAELLRDQPQRTIVIARELTKMHEEILSVRVGDLTEVVKKLTRKGEFVIVIAGKC
jgi:16S rRNA (cytidine1402-2'-O)-methyltransferase